MTSYHPDLAEALTLADRATQGPPTLRILNPADWQGKPIPPREWIVPNIIPAGTVSLLTGDGAAGKSTLGLQLGAARALGRDWLGTMPTPGRSLYLSAEDDEDEMHRRLEPICSHYGVSFAALSDFRLVDLVGQSAVLGDVARNGIIHATQLFDAVVAAIERISPSLVIVDALADVFAGEENHRASARQFIGLLKQPARRHRCAFLALAHPSLTGMASGTGTSGSTAWSNSVRSRLYFEPAKASDGSEPDPALRTLSLRKTNYGPPGWSVTVRWQDGAYVVQGGASTLDRLAAEKRAEDVFLGLLRAFEQQGRNVSPNLGTSYAPARFAEHPKAAGLSKREMAAAMQRLLDANSIYVEQFGPPSKMRSRLALRSGDLSPSSASSTTVPTHVHHPSSGVCAPPPLYPPGGGTPPPPVEAGGPGGHHSSGSQTASAGAQSSSHTHPETERTHRTALTPLLGPPGDSLDDFT